MSPRRRPAARLAGQELAPDSPVLAQVAEAERAAYLTQRMLLAPLPPAAERGGMTEAAWQRQVVALLAQLGCWVYHPKLSRWSEQGWPDLSVLHERRGRAFWLELKTDSGQLTETQVRVQQRMLACGLEVHTLRPWHTLERVAQLVTG